VGCGIVARVVFRWVVHSAVNMSRPVSIIDPLMATENTLAGYGSMDERVRAVSIWKIRKTIGTM